MSCSSLGPIELVVGLLQLLLHLRGHVVGTGATTARSAQACDFLVQDLVNFVFIDLVAIIIVFVFVGRALLAEDLEAVDGGNVGQRAILGIQIRVRFEQDVWEAEAKVGAVNIQVLLPRHVYFLAFGAVGLAKGDIWVSFFENTEISLARWSLGNEFLL